METLLRIRDLQYLVVIEEHQHLGRAAAAFGVSQPTLSAQLKRIEEALGFTIFHRNKRKLVLTRDGGEVVSEARNVLASFDRMRKIAGGDARPLGREVRFGVIPTVAPYTVTPLLRGLKALAGVNKVWLTEDITPRLEELIDKGTLDFALSATLPDLETVQALPVAREALIFVSARPRAKLSPRQPSSVPIVLMKEGHCFRDHVFKIVSANNNRAAKCMDFEVRPASFLTLLQIVREGLADTILPRNFQMRFPQLFDGLHIQRLDRPEHMRGVYLLVREDRADRADTNHVRAVCADVLCPSREPVIA